jgi:cobalt-zinc-cadmium efflux system outer membrane protein
MHASFLTRLTVVLLTIAASTVLAEAAKPGASELPQASANNPIGDHITLQQAVSRALRDSPSLAARTNAVSAAETRVTQAGLLPNPALELESESFGGSGKLDGFNAAESTAVVSQPFLLGGKRRHRRAVAESERALAGRDLETIRLDVTAGATSAFYRVLAAQQREALAHELLALAERFADTVQKRVAAGKVSPVEATRAGIVVSQARVELSRATRDLEARRVLLAASWGASAADFDGVVGELPLPTDMPAPGRLQQLLPGTPEVKLLGDLIERQLHVVDLERSFRIPDLTVSVGTRRFEETGESAWVAGISLPIPIFDRNQGARRAAEFDLERVRRDAEAVRIGLESGLASAYQRLQALALEVTALSHTIVPATQEAFASTETGYREGKLGFLDVLDAQRSLFDARMLLLDSREDYALARTGLERLIGQPLSPADSATSRTDTQDERFSATICTNLLRPGRLRKCSTYQRVALSFSQPPEHQDLGTSHSPEPLILGDTFQGEER